MTTRPRAADDFDAIRARIAELNKETKTEEEINADGTCAYRDGTVYIKTGNGGIKNKLTRWLNTDGTIIIRPSSKAQLNEWANKYGYKFRWVPYEELS